VEQSDVQKARGKNLFQQAYRKAGRHCSNRGLGVTTSSIGNFVRMCALSYPDTAFHITSSENGPTMLKGQVDMPIPMSNWLAIR